MTAALVLRADAFRLPLADATVDLIITSPPFWQLRRYTDAGRPLPDQVGAEATPRGYLETLWAATREMARVLKPTGSIFINVGDKYTSASGGQQGLGASTLDGHGDAGTPRDRALRARGRPTHGLPPKSLIGLPWLYAAGCTGALGMLGGADPALGLILRAELIWAKPNPIPESVRDRVRRAHEHWFHLVKQPRYYSSVDLIRQPYAPATPGKYATMPPGGWRETAAPQRRGVGVDYGGVRLAPNPLGRLPDSVWRIPAQPLRLPAHLRVRHYAAFPARWPHRLILGWSPPGICRVCGQGRWPVTSRHRQALPGTFGPNYARAAHGPDGRAGMRAQTTSTLRGWACACTPSTDHPDRRVPTVTPNGLVNTQDQAARRALGLRRRHDGWPLRLPVRDYDLEGWTPPPTTPAVVVDVFGTGTTAMAASQLGRLGISIDLSADYARVAKYRTAHHPRAGKGPDKHRLGR